jgi:hypothetical protein
MLGHWNKTIPTCYQHSLSNNITLLKVLDLAKIVPINLVFLGWPCHGLSLVGVNQ